MRPITASSLAVLALAAAASSASASIWQFNWTNSPGSGVNNAGGNFESIASQYNGVTGDFSWSATFSNQVTKGFTLAISPGPNPKGHPGELALLYFDARNAANPILTGYGYNAQNDQTSFSDGSNAGGTQAPDTLFTSIAGKSLAKTTSLGVIDAGGKRTLTIAFNALDVNNRIPMYPNNPNDWTGVGFGANIGVWFHTFSTLSAGYDNNGLLTGWSGTQGWLDGENFKTTQVPAPAAAGLLGLSGIVAMRRRRA